MKLVLLNLLIALLVLAVWLIWGGAWEERFTLAGAVAWLEGTGRWAWAAGMGLLVADFFLPVPGTVVISALGYLYGPWWGGLAASAGSVAAGMFGYGMGRLIGEKAARRLLGDRDFDRGRSFFERRGGGWAVTLSRSLPILPEVLSCTAGLVRMPFGRFCVALVCGSLPMGFLFAWVGAVGRESPAWALAFSLGIPALLWWLASRLTRRDEHPVAPAERDR